MLRRSLVLLFSILLAGIALAQVPLADHVDLTAEPVHAMVDQPPEFPGGLIALRMYLLENMIIADTLADGILNGTVKVRFVVDRNGKVRDPSIIFSMQPDVDGEALRVIGAMPDWQPGRLRGKAVNVMYVLPIKFGKG
ncbi:MAG: energy transducer TonB [Flavobacteriales bacterium]